MNEQISLALLTDIVRFKENVDRAVEEIPVRESRTINPTLVVSIAKMVIACGNSCYFASSICFTRLTTAGSISYKPFTIFSMPGPSIGSISSLAFSASAIN